MKIKPYDRVVIGDVHGQINLLNKLLEEFRDSKAHLLFLGDLVDRASEPGDDYEVLSLVKSLQEKPSLMGLASVDSLRGNHEQMLIDAMKGHSAGLMLWIQNGGDVEELEKLKEFQDWLQNRPYFIREENIVYVHAGLRPGVPLDQQNPDDLLWIRTPFLRAKSLNIAGVEKVVHGHTWKESAKPIRTRFSVGVDTGAFYTGVLTAYHPASDSFRQVFSESEI